MIERRDGEDSVVLHAGGRPQPPRRVARQGAAIAPRRHGAMLRSGDAMLPTDDTFCATAWMHGVFAAQLTIGNTAFHKLFSVSRDPYNIMRGNGLRILVDLGDGWRLLAVPSAFEMGLCDCRWLYRLGGPDDHRLGAASRARSPRCNGASQSKAANAVFSSSAILSSASTNTRAAAASRSTREASASSFARIPRACGASAIRAPPIVW